MQCRKLPESGTIAVVRIGETRQRERFRCNFVQYGHTSEWTGCPAEASLHPGVPLVGSKDTPQPKRRRERDMITPGQFMEDVQRVEGRLIGPQIPIRTETREHLELR